MTECPGCSRPVNNISGGEVWHGKCFDVHRKQVKGECTEHRVCQRITESKQAS